MSPPILALVFTIQLALSLISTVGAQAINDLAWRIFTLLPTEHSTKAAKTTQLRNEVVRLQREMASVSAQDNFAKWARLRREHDKAKDVYDKNVSQTSGFRSSFDSILNKLRWLGTQGVNFLVNGWFSKQGMFWLPRGWVPYAGEWVLSFPRAPLGSVSVNVWGMACGMVIGLVVEAAGAAWTLKGRTEDIKKVQEVTGEKEIKTEKRAMPKVEIRQRKEL